MDGKDILNDPAVQGLMGWQAAMDTLVTVSAVRLLDLKDWLSMDASERDICIRHIVGTVESEAELRERLDALGVGTYTIEWVVAGSDSEETEVLMKTLMKTLRKSLGMLVSKNGALVKITTPDFRL
jgi:hypothetical protein